MHVRTLDGNRSAPYGLLVSIARNHDPTLPHQHLSKARAVVTKGRFSSPCIGNAEELPSNLNSLINVERSKVRGDITPLDVRLSIVGKPFNQCSGALTGSARTSRRVSHGMVTRGTRKVTSGSR